MNYAVGTNMPGYLPDSEPWITFDIDAAKRSMIEELLNDADNADERGDHDEAEELSAAAEDLNVTNIGPDAYPSWGTTIGNRAYWIEPTDEEADDEGEEL